MIYLSGVHNAKIAEAAKTLPLGLINTPNIGYRPGTYKSYRWWAADNGCFSQGENFSSDAWLMWLDGQPRDKCLFAVAPDVPMNAEATLAKFWEGSVAIRSLGFPVALAAQNGLEDRAIPWALFDCLFIGGDTEWKLGHAAHRIAVQARLMGKWVHMGRVNSRRRLHRAAEIGCHSADGTFLRWPDANLSRLRAWFVGLESTA
jgi:hypothetical protein